MPYYNYKHIPSVHGRFNNLLGDNLHLKKTLETLHSLYDYDIFNMNSFNANIDPDFNFLEPRLRSRYFSPHSFAETIKSKINQNHRNFIPILHSNIRSLERNFEQFHQHVLSELKVNFSVIGLTEIRIRDDVCNENLPSLPNYYFEYVTKPLSAGGVGMFFAEPRTHAVPLFLETKQLPISFLLFEQMSLLMYDVHNNLAPDNIKNMFTLKICMHKKKL